MGEIAEMMLDGTLCAGCGTLIDEESGAGVPRYCCDECAIGCGAEPDATPRPPRSTHNARKAQRVNDQRAAAAGPKPFKCSICPKRFKYQSALGQHARDAHGRPTWDIGL